MAPRTTENVLRGTGAAYSKDGVDDTPNDPVTGFVVSWVGCTTHGYQDEGSGTNGFVQSRVGEIDRAIANTRLSVETIITVVVKEHALEGLSNEVIGGVYAAGTPGTVQETLSFTGEALGEGTYESVGIELSGVSAGSQVYLFPKCSRMSTLNVGITKTDDRLVQLIWLVLHDENATGYTSYRLGELVPS